MHIGNDFVESFNYVNFVSRCMKEIRGSGLLLTKRG